MQLPSHHLFNSQISRRSYDTASSRPSSALDLREPLDQEMLALQRKLQSPLSANVQKWRGRRAERTRDAGANAYNSESDDENWEVQSLCMCARMRTRVPFITRQL